MSVSSEFPSKILLFGEYTVLVGSKALAIPIDIFSGEFNYIRGNTDHAAFDSNRIIFELFHYLEKSLISLKLNLKKLKHDIEAGLYFHSSIPHGYGAGSSGALSAAIYHHYSHERTHDLNELKHNLAAIESFFHGKSSGTDALVSFIQEPILFKEGEISTIDLPKLQHQFFLIDTLEKRNTSVLVERFMQMNEDAAFKIIIKDEWCPMVNNCIHSFLNSKDDFTNRFKDLSHFQYNNLSEFIPQQLRPYWLQGLESQSFYLKLCGAGGGGYLLGFSRDDFWAMGKEGFIMFPKPNRG